MTKQLTAGATATTRPTFISPWTAQDTIFFEELPGQVYCQIEDGEIVAAAFVEEEELVYLYGKTGLNAVHLVRDLLTQTEHSLLTFEADDCDPIAYALLKQLGEQPSESWNTFIWTNQE